MQRQIFKAVLLFVACLLIGFIFAAQLRLMSVVGGFKMSWPDAIRWELTRWCLWAFLLPMLFYLGKRFPLYPWSAGRFFLVHIPASILLSLIHLILFSLVYWFVFRFVQAFSLHHSLGETLLIDLAKTIRNAEFDPQKIFKMIFSIDFHIGILVYLIVLALHQAGEYSRRTADLKSQLAAAQLDSLKMQLHPHFLFNTLNSISALLHKDVEAADEMIGELGNFLRLTLQNRASHEVSLEQELKFLRSYLEIERVRFQSRLTVEIDIDPQTLEALVPNLILQPIIENAIRYGIAPRPEAGRIEVHSRKLNRHLHLQVLDDGPGLPEAPSEGIGLGNIRERLERLYGADHHFFLSNRPEGGLQVEIKIPFRTNALNPEEENV